MKIPEHLKLAIAREYGGVVPEIPDGWEYVDFSTDAPDGTFWLPVQGGPPRKSDRRIVVRKKRRKVRFGDLKVGIIFWHNGKQFIKTALSGNPLCHNASGDGLRDWIFTPEGMVEVEGGPEVELPKPKRMMHNPTVHAGMYIHRPHPEEEDCARLGCVPVEPAKPRRWVVEIEAAGHPKDVEVTSTDYIVSPDGKSGRFVRLKHGVMDIREVEG